ncbi:MAG: type IV-A pilus assembly ATPase PilB, partial [Deltaproteobacteria bacterium]
MKGTVKDQSGAGKTRIGELLCKEGQITSFQLQEALKYQKKNKGRLGSILLRLGYIEEETIANVLSRMLNYPAVIISKTSPDPEALKILPYNVAKKYMAFPLKTKEGALEVCMAEPTDTSAVEELQYEVRKDLTVCVSTEKDIIDAYKKYYDVSDEEYNSFFGEKIEEEDEDPVTQVDDF